MAKLFCIYHGNCADGFGAAWAVRHRFGDFVEFHAGTYGEPPPNVHGRHVLLVDFSYKRPVLLEMAKAARSLCILDHHKTAAEDMAGFSAPPPVSTWWYFGVPSDTFEPQEPTALFDMNRSGAGLTWDFLHPKEPRPRLIDVIEDRDLWRFKLPKTREIQAALFSYPYDFAVWDELMRGDLDALALQGEAIERKHFKDIAELVGVSKRPMKIGGHIVPVANLPYTLTSDAGNMMAEGQPFAACYMDTPRGRVFSLRSKAEGLDVSEIAKAYGGGGHKNAAGFTLPFDQLAQFEP